jgi:hypothetical protein
MIKIKEQDSILAGCGCGDGDEFYKVDLKDLFNLKIVCGSIPDKDTAMKACVPYLIKNKIHDCEILTNDESPDEICYFGGFGFTEKTAHIFEWMIGKNGGSFRSDGVDDETTGLCTFESE